MLFEDPFTGVFDVVSALEKRDYYVESLVVITPRVYYQYDVRIRAIVSKYYRMSARMGLPAPSYAMDGLIVLSDHDPRLTESWINAALWSYANEIRKLYLEVDSIILRLKLAFANTDDLDDHWGPLLRTKRKLNESNEDYRVRLMTYIAMISTSGTATKCQQVIDAITGKTGGSRLETYYPGEIKLVWTAPDVIKIAEAKHDIISIAMDRMIASGMSWSTSYPYAEYRMDMYWMIHPETITYDMDGTIAKRRGITYYMTSGIWETPTLPLPFYEMECLLYDHNSTTYRARVNIMGSVKYLMDGYIIA